jgi:hypothetical protein
MWVSIGSKQSAGAAGHSYEYIYFGDTNTANLPGYSMDMSSGVLTQIPNTPAVGGNSISLGKINSSTQVLSAVGAAFLINPTTGVLNPVTGGGFLSSSILNAEFSSSGLFVYSSTFSNGWIAQVNSTTGNLTNATATANFPAPINHVYYTELSPDGNFVYYIDPFNSAIAGYSTAGGALNLVAGANVGTGVNVGDKTYGLTLLPTPNAGIYSTAIVPYFDSGANVIFLTYNGAAGTDNNWIIPYKINNDGSLTAGALLNIGTNIGNGVGGSVVGDSSGKYLFIAMFSNNGINSYSIGANGALTLVSGPLFAGASFDNLTINSESSILIAQYHGAFGTASTNISTGILTPVSTFFSPCTFTGPVVLDSSERFIYLASTQAIPNVICGLTIDPYGNLGAISGQTYPLAVPGSSSITSGLAVKTQTP